MNLAQIMVLMAIVIIAPHVEGRIAAGVGAIFCLFVALLYTLGVR